MASGQSSSKVEVLWSPNKDEDFATYSNELKLYTFKERDGEHLSASDIKLSTNHIGQLSGSLSSDIQCMPIHQRVAWQPNQTRPYFFAVGQSSGKVVLSNLGIDQPGTIAPMNQVLGPKYGRPCTCLAWHPTESHLLAQGLEKWRAGSSIIVWDITRASSDRPRPLHATPSSLTSSQDFSSTSDDSAAKLFDIGSAEGTASLAWLPGQHTSCLVAGMGTRYLRIYDIREGAHTTNPRDIPVANHKAIQGLCVDPTSPERLATYTEGTVFLWDIRHFSKPSYSFSRNGAVVRLAWLPTRMGCLSVVFTEPPYLRLMDIPQLTQSTDVQGDLTEIYSDHFTQRLTDRCPYYMKRGGYPKLMGVAWHNKWENFGLITSAEGLVRELVAYDRISLSFAGSGKDVTYGSGQLYTASPAEGQEVDISTKMRRRVKQGYGFDPCENIKLLSDDKPLTQVWMWLKLHRELTAKGDLPATPGKGPKTLLGVYNVLRVNGHREGEAVSVSKRVSWQDRERSPPSREVTPPFSTFTGTERQLALKLCGWSFGNEGQDLEDYLKREEVGENFERAAAIAVFQGRIRRGIASLKDGAGVAQKKGNAGKGAILNLIALALSGYSPQEKKLWHETCAGVKAQVANPYLRAAFNFLCSSGRDGFKEVLDEVDMSLQDRVAFASTYLEDAVLYSYISKLTKEVTESGQINGLFLTGLTDEGITLLTNYVNKTGDVQTACLVAGQVMPFAIKIKQVQAWFQGYRDLLDVWQLWHERALFDGQRKKLDSQFKPQRQAFIMCNYCSKSIASDSLRHDRRAAHQTAMGRKMTSCPSCRKPLPRCSVCLMNMSAAGCRSPGQTRESAASKTSCGPFSQWFTWCQTCRHGGHAKHMADWFSNHQECPVAGCSCHCFALDASV